MKAEILSLISFLYIAGCTSLPSQPKAGENTFAVQVISIGAEVPVQNPTSVEKLLKSTDAVIYEYPVSYLEFGKPMTNDQSFKMDTPEEYDIEPYFWIDRNYEMAIINASTCDVTYAIDINHWDFTGHSAITFEDGSEQVWPCVKGAGVTTEITQPLGEWNIISGMVSDSDGNESQSAYYFCIRIMPPKSTPSQFDPSTVDDFWFCSGYYPSDTIYLRDEISPQQAIDLAQKFALSYYGDFVDIESAKVTGNSVYEWVVEFRIPESKIRGTTSNRAVKIDKKTGESTIGIVE